MFHTKHHAAILKYSSSSPAALNVALQYIQVVVGWFDFDQSRAWLVPGWVTVCAYTTVLVFNTATQANSA